ncbi:2-oxoacid:acceptor oxidoreductase family protein [Candidatus Riflebacteria bacterium]
MSNTRNIIIAGFGGQGVLLLGKLIAMAGLADNREVSWIPSYGPEMRGGTANCTVRISDTPIGSPVVSAPNSLIAMNLPSIDKFENDLEEGGLLIYNTSLINRAPVRKDVKLVPIPASDLANEKLKNTKLTNMILFGAFLKHTEFVSEEIAFKALEESVSKRHAKLIPLNKEAIKLGFNH